MIINLIRLVLFLVFAATTNVAFGVEVIAHRANGCGMTENSIGAVRSSFAAGVDAVELDVRVSLDGIAYLFHDDEIGSRPVLAMEYSELQSVAGAAGTPTLSETLGDSTFTGLYVLDLKQINTSTASHVAKVVKHSAVNLNQIIFQSDDRRVLQALHEMLPTGRYYLLERLKRRFPFFRSVKAERIAATIPTDYIEGVSLKGRLFIDKLFVSTLKNAGLRVFVWTINEKSRAHYYQAIGVDGLITDVPLDLAGVFGRNVSRSGACKQAAGQ